MERRILRSTDIRGPHDLGGHPSDRPAALGQVHDHQPDEDEADDGVIGDPHVQELKRAQCRRGRAQQRQMDRETGSGTPRGPAPGGTFELPRRRHEWRVRHRSPAGVLE